MTFTKKERQALIQAAAWCSTGFEWFSCVSVKRAMHKHGFSDFEAREMVRIYEQFYHDSDTLLEIRHQGNVWLNGKGDGESSLTRSMLILFFLEAHS